MNLSGTAVSKWLIAIGSCVGSGLVAYATVHKGPPVTSSDWWDVLIVVLTGAGLGAAGRGTNVGIQKAKESRQP